MRSGLLPSLEVTPHTPHTPLALHAPLTPHTPLTPLTPLYQPPHPSSTPHTPPTPPLSHTSHSACITYRHIAACGAAQRLPPTGRPAPPVQALTQLDGGAAARGASAGAATEARLAVEMPELHALALALAAGQQP